jgi:hypothetical protein
MDTLTAGNNICLHQSNTLKLRVVQHKYAAKIANHARPVRSHAKALIKLFKQILSEAVSLASPNCFLFHGLRHSPTSQISTTNRAATS